ncbi:MAG TPA: alanine dehydrogenase [Actinomycetota bacterium]|nr:alanine dehydrogenase [Actinomycetota bacterium]
MIVGVPREVKDNEYRVAVTPAGVRELTAAGHEVLVEAGAGEGSAIPDEAYRKFGARMASEAAEVWGSADLVLKVKEPVAEEYANLHEDQVLFTYLHLAADRPLTEALIERKVVAVAYETVQLGDGRLPLLAPMSEVAGRMAPQVGAHALERENGGRGVLLGGVSGVHPARVVVLGAGMAGSNAAWIAAGMEGEVIIIDRDVDKLRGVDLIHKGRILTVTSNRLAIEHHVGRADLVIGAVLIPGAKAPKLVTEEMVAGMRPGSVIVDISIDQGGCVETSRMTTHSAPTFEKHGVVHYAVGNMPGAVPRTSTYALTNVTLPYAVEIASRGLEDAVRADPALARGVNVYGGAVTNAPVADAHGMDHTPLSSVVAGAPD